MNTLTKQIVYLPAKEDYGIYLGYSDGYSNKGNLQPEQGYFFTPEQLNEYTQVIIKQTLETAGKVVDNELEKDFLNKQSIMDTFEETYKKFEV